MAPLKNMFKKNAPIKIPNIPFLADFELLNMSFNYSLFSSYFLIGFFK